MKYLFFMLLLGLTSCTYGDGPEPEEMLEKVPERVVYFEYPEEEFEAITSDKENPDYMLVYKSGDTLHLSFDTMSEEEKAMYPYRFKADSMCGMRERYTDTWVEIASGDR